MFCFFKAELYVPTEQGLELFKASETMFAICCYNQGCQIFLGT
jgi:hypothetical protein